MATTNTFTLNPLQFRRNLQAAHRRQKNTEILQAAALVPGLLESPTQDSFERTFDPTKTAFDKDRQLRSIPIGLGIIGAPFTCGASLIVLPIVAKMLAGDSIHSRMKKIDHKLQTETDVGEDNRCGAVLKTYLQSQKAFTKVQKHLQQLGTLLENAHPKPGTVYTIPFYINNYVYASNGLRFYQVLYVKTTDKEKALELREQAQRANVLIVTKNDGTIYSSRSSDVLEPLSLLPPSQEAPPNSDMPNAGSATSGTLNLW